MLYGVQGQSPDAWVSVGEDPRSCHTM